MDPDHAKLRFRWYKSVVYVPFHSFRRAQEIHWDTLPIRIAELRIPGPPRFGCCFDSCRCVQRLLRQIPRMKLKERLTFLRALSADPGLVGAIAPSGPALARLITSEIRHDSGHIVEFGPGTGVFTRALLAQGV